MGSIRIAVCDDHPLFRTGVASVLSTQPDMEVLVNVGSISELIEKLGGQTVDIILLDVELSGETGLDALPTLARSSRVLMFSAFDEPEYVKRAMELGAVGYVLKDAVPRELFRCIRDVAEGRTVLDTDLASRVAQSLRKEPDEFSLEQKVRSLTPRQREVMALLEKGNSAGEIAGALFISEGTAKNHITRILQLLEVPDRAKLVHLLARYKTDY